MSVGKTKLNSTGVNLTNADMQGSVSPIERGRAPHLDCPTASVRVYSNSRAGDPATAFTAVAEALSP